MSFIDNYIQYSILSPSAVSVIGFSSPPNPWNLTIPSTVTYLSNTYNVIDINTIAFKNCFNLTSVSIANSVLTIGQAAFYACTNLVSAILPNNITTLNDEVFLNCSNLPNITIPNSVTNIGYAVFLFCTSFTNIIIPDSVLTIGQAAFQQCTNLTSINIPPSITILNDAIFFGCSSLPSITIPRYVTFIDKDAFLSCNSLKSVTFDGNIPSISPSGNFGVSGDTAYYYKGAFNTNILPSFFTYVKCIDCPECVWKCDKNKWDKYKFSSVGNNPNISYNQQISIKIKTTVGGSVQYGSYYLGKPIQVNYLGRTEGQSGGSGAPPRNKF